VAETFLLRGARQLLTLQGSADVRRGAALGDLSIIPDGALLIRDGIIIEVGMSRRVENLAAARNAKVIDATGRVVMPAFVDSGMSLVFSHHAEEKNDERLRAGLPHTSASQRADILDAVRALKLVSKKRLILPATSICDGLPRLGTGTAAAISGFGLHETGELKILRSLGTLGTSQLEIVPVLFGANAVPYGTTAAKFIDDVLLPLTRTVARRKLASIAAVRFGPCAFEMESSCDYVAAIRNFGLRSSIFSQQFETDRSVELAIQEDAISLVHQEHMRIRDCELLARCRTVAVLTPAATIHMGLTRFAPARELIDNGAAVALATGFNPDQCPTYSMQFTIAMACRYLRMSAAEAIVASTINAAHAIGRSNTIGTLECGKQADILILNARDYREVPMAPGLNLVQSMIKAGRAIAN
jgi:imidazolonepropionase